MIEDQLNINGNIKNSNNINRIIILVGPRSSAGRALDYLSKVTGFDPVGADNKVHEDKRSVKHLLS